MTLLITKDATSNKVHVFSATDEQIKSFNEADMGEAMMGWPVTSAAELADTSLTTGDLVELHNTSHPSSTLKPSATQSKRQIAQTVFDGLAKFAMPYDASLLKARRSTSTVVAKETTPMPATKPKRLSKDEPWRREPVLPIRAARAGKCSAFLIDVLKRGRVTVKELNAAVPNWQESSVTSALLTDINAKNGYGILKEHGDGEFVYSLIYPEGMTEPLAHITKEKK